MVSKYFEKAEKKYFYDKNTKLKEDKSKNEDIKNFTIPTDKYGNSKTKIEIVEYAIKD